MVHSVWPELESGRLCYQLYAISHTLLSPRAARFTLHGSRLLSEKPADFFSLLLLEHLYDELQMDTVVLQVAFSTPDMIELLPPIDFEARTFLGQDHPTQPDSHACQGLRIGRLVFGVPSMAEIDELRKLQPVFAGCEPQQWKARFK